MTHYRPPSIDRLEQATLKDCPCCGCPEINYDEDYEGYICGQELCEMSGPVFDRDGHKWNSIPRRSEVRELLDIIDRAASEEDPLIADVLFMSMVTLADKLRKEWNL